MKKFNGIILMVLAVILVGLIFVKAETTNVNHEVIDVNFDVAHGITGSNADELVKDWCRSVHEVGEYNTIDENGYFTGYGVLYADEFEEEYGICCDSRAMEKILRDHYDLENFEITRAGFIHEHDGTYTIYKMEAKSKTEPIGYVYIDGEHVDYYEGCVYFMVYSND